MASLAIAMLSLQAWTYAEFMAPPSSPFPPIAQAWALPTTIRSEVADQSPRVVPRETSLPPPDAVKRVRSAPVSPPPRPRYRLADVSGQVWEHDDPEWLQTFVEQCNRQMLGLPR